MTVKIKRKGTHIEDSDISAFEQRIDINLPADYREFLAENNGGVPEANEFDIPGLNGGSGINEFLSIKEIEATKERLGERFFLNAWPIAHAEGGNYLCLVLGEQVGIYFWDHELEAEEEKLPSWENLFFLSNSFQDFLEMLQKFDPDEVEVPPGSKVVWVDPEFKKQIQRQEKRNKVREIIGGLFDKIKGIIKK